MQVLVEGPKPQPPEVVAFTGELDLATTARALHSVLDALWRESVVVVDLRAVTFVDVAGLHALVRMCEWAARHGREVQFAHPPQCFTRILELTQSTDRVVWVDASSSVDAAAASSLEHFMQSVHDELAARAHARTCASAALAAGGFAAKRRRMGA